MVVYACIGGHLVTRDSWEELLTHLYDNLNRMSSANVIVYLSKYKLFHPTVTYLFMTYS
jgi:hypothetical protein